MPDAHTSRWACQPSHRRAPSPCDFAERTPRCASVESSHQRGRPALSLALRAMGLGPADPCAALRAPAFGSDGPSAHVPAGRGACSLPRPVALRRRAPRRPRRRLWHTAHLLPLSPPPPPLPGLDGGPPTSATQKEETRRRRRRHLRDESPDLPASPRSRRRGPVPAVPAVEKLRSLPRPGLPGHSPLRSHSHSGPRAAPCSRN